MGKRKADEPKTGKDTPAQPEKRSSPPATTRSSPARSGPPPAATGHAATGDEGQEQPDNAEDRERDDDQDDDDEPPGEVTAISREQLLHDWLVSMLESAEALIGEQKGRVTGATWNQMVGHTRSIRDSLTKFDEASGNDR